MNETLPKYIINLSVKGISALMWKMSDQEKG